MIPVDLTPSMLRGGAELERTARGLRVHRLPEWVRTQYPDGQLLMMESQPSGVRLALRTSANAIELVTHPTRVAYRGADRARGNVDVFVNGSLFARDLLTGGDVFEIDLTSGASTLATGPSRTSRITGLPAGDSRIEIWLPHNETVELVSLHADAPVLEDDEHLPIWLHHGSSISHGSNATAPSETWPAIASRLAHVDLHNLGFGGSALVDPFMARVIRDRPADAISVKLGINTVNTDAMRLRAFVPAVHGFLDTIRDGHPTTPILLISPIFAGIHERTPGPGAVDTATLGTDHVQFIATGDPDDIAHGKLTLEVIRRELASLVERRAADQNLHYLDGLDLFGADDARAFPLPDGLHPGPDAHRLIGERFADIAFGTGGMFSED
ncbi:lipase [Frondihabitans sp. PAMC 28766]|uniref:GDSL-type esterase/lipase family protein n=1 Tax=Frondihabitans sp. PAMC 28766 TaxID=1795630 RepID=UPI00078DAE32|nr:GDSL-type esterase/lipase family protein [Frondihabitans sp. PAMC 28766]AMM20158.1 lipase [Frondihabitans sp. PAMC 28766]